MHCTRQDTDNSYVDETIHYIITDTADNKGILHRIIYIQTNKHRNTMTKREKITEIVYTLIAEGLVDPIRIIFDTEYCAESVAQYIEAANIARSALKMPLINLEDYPD